MPRGANTILLDDIATRRALQPGRVEPARDDASAGEGVRLAYSAAGLPPPAIVWCRSPIELAGAWAGSVMNSRPGANVKHLLFDRPYAEGKRRIGSATVRNGRAYIPPGHETSPATGAVVSQAVADAVGEVRPRLLHWLWRAVSGSVLQVASRPVFAASGCGPAELYGAGLLSRAEEARDGRASDALDGLRMIGDNAGWLLPHERVCWLSERPDVLCTDADGRLHCATGPALRYRDGWSRFAWKGVLVPAWVIERPQDITLDWIDAQIDPAVRHAMIDIYTAERFVDARGAHPIAWDSRGVLWSRTWMHRGIVIDSWRAVEYAGASGYVRALRPVPSHLETPGQALDWLLGMPAACDAHRRHLPPASVSV